MVKYSTEIRKQHSIVSSDLIRMWPVLLTLFISGFGLFNHSVGSTDYDVE
jgi:hypothetical protein